MYHLHISTRTSLLACYCNAPLYSRMLALIGCLLWVVFIACRWCSPEVEHKETYDNAGFDPDEALPNGSVSYDVTDTAGDFVVVDQIPPKKIEGQNGQVLEETRVDTPETAAKRNNRFVRPTSVIQGELSLECVAELPVKGNSQSDIVTQQKGRLHRPTSVQEGRVSFEFASESDVLSIDSDTHSLYPEIFILPTEDETKQRRVIEEETDEGQSSEKSLSVETIEVADDLNFSHVPGDEIRSQSMTDGLGSKSPSERQSLSRNGSFVESDEGQQSVSVPTKPDSDQVMESPRNDEELSHPGETVAHKCQPESQECASETAGLPLSEKETEERLRSSGIENLKTGNTDSENKVIEDNLPSRLDPVTSDERNSPIPKDEDTTRDAEKIETPKHIVNSSPEILKSPNRNVSKNKRPLPNFSISSFDNKSIDNDNNRKKFRSPSLRNAMAAGCFSDSSFVERLNDVIGQKSGSRTSSDLKRETGVGKPVKEKEIDDDLEDDVFISSEDVPPKEVVRERLESFLSNIPSRTSTTRFKPEQLPQKVANNQTEAWKVEDQNLSHSGGGTVPTPESTFIEKLDAIMRRRGSLPPKKKKDKAELLSAEHTLPERRNSKAESDVVPSKAEIRRTLENLFLSDPKRGVTKVEEMSTVL